ncbi:hypothetical protein BUALT_Bualt13G0119300 [Buddleja alternifolia]|uniref:DUF4283 domain-containing protein n=1 Tax=Buddleja alternifolia TaxID=168488 RepID=A0AAV6WXU1_9LAMI|nr:hypothetical protein BUALT_Bualt13G0119300 [Buddleja alternifolia]
MLKAWNPQGSVSTSSVETNAMTFIFFLKSDAIKVLNSGPWSYRERSWTWRDIVKCISTIKDGACLRVKADSQLKISSDP